MGILNVNIIYKDKNLSSSFYQRCWKQRTNQKYNQFHCAKTRVLWRHLGKELEEIGRNLSDMVDSDVRSVSSFLVRLDEGTMLQTLGTRLTMLETLDYTIRIGSTPTFLYFDLYLYSAYAAHYV